VSSSAFAAQLDEQFERDLQRSAQIAPGRWNARPLPARLKEGLTKITRREL
jgi:hypothetical protein